MNVKLAVAISKDYAYRDSYTLSGFAANRKSAAQAARLYGDVEMEWFQQHRKQAVDKPKDGVMAAQPRPRLHAWQRERFI